jgi:hypothetical protein
MRGITTIRAARAAATLAIRPIGFAQRAGYATSVTGMGKEVEGFVGAVGHTPLVSIRHMLRPCDAGRGVSHDTIATPQVMVFR